jgi:hypothetical protein
MRYEIRIAGVMLESTAREEFPELEPHVVTTQTILCGPVVDEAQLYGLLVRCQKLGLRVMEFRRLPE